MHLLKSEQNVTVLWHFQKRWYPHLILHLLLLHHLHLLYHVHLLPHHLHLHFLLHLLRHHLHVLLHFHLYLLLISTPIFFFILCLTISIFFIILIFFFIEWANALVPPTPFQGRPGHYSGTPCQCQCHGWEGFPTNRFCLYNSTYPGLLVVKV